ncbi:cellulose biosynthesis cyclic di-GMP-binding regulatory protein BcsB [Devosia sp.]|uniref:cellulose biosynthesis cyclic di-GMP-binding regulatory protein BcsB n=1 Tax=Devosia sp. TaxID=1871048 RepID=UPI002AFECDE9|nr:cellulose biosynthesis cyclic di-GMP-binding regulatory protein BcsB [Devosia sp.]
MIKRSLLVSLILGTALSAPLAQPAPFDMSPERELVTPSVPAAPPDALVPLQPVVAGFERHFLPGASMQLVGEESRQASVLYLTGEQAAAPARLVFSYLNALVVAPEFSSLRVLLNGTQVATTPVMASAAPGLVDVAVPAGLLQAGANIVEFRATQRHRTDCSIASSYELWSQLASPDVRLVFEGEGLGRITHLADLAALGLDSAGASTLRLLGGSMPSSPQATGAMLDLVQQLAIAWRVAELHIEPDAGPADEYREGALDLLVAPASELPVEFDALRAQASQGPLAMLLPSGSGANRLVISGPDWASIAQAGEAIRRAAPAADRPRLDLAYPHPLLEGGSEISLSALGMTTVEFNGRRYAEQIGFDLPPDFYAQRYGEMELVLDAAYSSDVLPGSEIDVYVNGQIASATPLLRTDGGMLRDTVIRIPMTHLQPGRNLMEIAVNLQSASDALCSPGWTGEAPVRFVFSDTSRLRLPDYARATLVPDLKLLTGSASPYADAASVPLVMARDQGSVLSVMAFLARMATASGKVTPVSLVEAASLDPADNALIVSPYAGLPAPILSRMGLTRTSAAMSGDGDALNRFGGEAAHPVQWLADLLGDGIGLKAEDLRVLPAAEPGYVPPPGTLALAQRYQPEGGLWTVLTAPDEASLTLGTQRLIETAKWRQVAGRLAAFGPNDADPVVTPADNAQLTEPLPRSFANLRLVAANWFSGRILFYTALIAAASIMLMGATALVLSRVGRRE